MNLSRPRYYTPGLFYDLNIIMQEFRLICDFDITATGAYSYRPVMIPGLTKTGYEINDKQDWFRVVNQQRNWDTVQQILSLRTQIELIELPQYVDQQWHFTVGLDSNRIASAIDKSLYIIENDFNNVPIILGLLETKTKIDQIQTSGKNKNLTINTL